MTTELILLNLTIWLATKGFQRYINNLHILETKYLAVSLSLTHTQTHTPSRTRAYKNISFQTTFLKWIQLWARLKESS